MKCLLTRSINLLAVTLLIAANSFSQPELVVDTAQSDTLQAFAFSPDGKVFATVTSDNAIRLWDVATGKNTNTLVGHTGQVTTVAFSGDLVASGSTDRTVRIWQLSTGRVRLETRGHTAAITQVAFSPGGKYCVSASLDDTVMVWDASTGQRLKTLNAQKQGLTSVAISPDGRYVGGGGRNSLIRVFEIASGVVAYTLEGHLDVVTAVAFSADGKLFASASLDGSIRIWPTSSNAQPRSIATAPGYVKSLAFTSDGHGVISGAYGTPPRLAQRENGAALVFSLTSLTGNPESGAPGPALMTSRQLCKLFSFRDSSWAVLDSEGRYDASFGGEIPWLKWKLGNKSVALNQLKVVFYQPGLLAKLLGFSKEPLLPIIKLTEIKPYPDVAFTPPDKGSARLTIQLVDSGGGIGRVQVKLNSTEIYEDAHGTLAAPAGQPMTIDVDLAGPALMPGKPNKIQVVAWNAENYLSSPTDAAVSWTPLELTGQPNGGQPDDSPVEFHAIVIGVSEYSDSSIRLKYRATLKRWRVLLRLGQSVCFPEPAELKVRGASISNF